MGLVDDSGFLSGMEAIEARVRAVTPQLVAKGAAVLERAGMGRTKVRSGSLRRSWHVTGPVESAAGASALVGPTMIYARRQELGFKGRDSLGRVYTKDPGWPYVKPSMEESITPIRALFVSGLAEAIHG